MKTKKPVHLPSFLLLVAFFCVPPARGQSLVDPAVEGRIDSLLERMTLEEKVGQLNQYSGFFNTGPAAATEQNKRRNEEIRSGQVGSMLNVAGAEATRRAQQLAVEGSRLGIPLIFGLDVIHGYKTSFPVPLAEAASFDLEAIELSARISAREAAAAGVHWTFAPMVDIARDARWGRIVEGAGRTPTWARAWPSPASAASRARAWPPSTPSRPARSTMQPTGSRRRGATTTPSTSPSKP